MIFHIDSIQPQMYSYGVVKISHRKDTVMTIRIKGFDSEAFDEAVVTIEAWYDRHTKLWVIQKLNKDGYQVGDAVYVYGKEAAMKAKAEMEEELK